MENTEKKTMLTGLAQAFLKAAELEQTDDSITIRFEEHNKNMILPAVRDFTNMLDDVDEENFMETNGFEDEEEEDDRDY